MNTLKYLFYMITHSILCLFKYHRLITWNNDIKNGDKQCWCCKVVGGGWLIKEDMTLTSKQLKRINEVEKDLDNKDYSKFVVLITKKKVT